MSTTLTTDSNLQLVNDFNEAVFVDHEFDRLDEFVAEDVAQVEAGEVAFEGIDALCAYFEEMLESWENPEMDVVSMLADDDTVMYNFWMTGTAREDFEMGDRTIEAEGRELAWEGFVRLTIEDGRIVEANLLTDEAAILRQLGVIPERAA